MQQEVDPPDTARRERVEQRCREMKSRRWRGHGARLPGINGLVPLGIGWRVGAMDVRRERHVTVRLDGFLDRYGRVEADDTRPALGDFLDMHVEARRDVDDASRAKFSAGMYEGFVLSVRTGWPQEQDFGGRARIAVTEQTGAEDAGRIQDDRVASGNELDEVREVPMLERA